MKELFVLLKFGGFTALLLWGVHMVQTGVQRAFGARLSVIMSRALGTRIRSFLTGLGITAAIQSSTATGLMITSFAAGGMVALMPALAAMLGANVGTTIIVQLLSFNLTALAPVFILMGVWMFRHFEPGRRRDMGRVFIGFGLLLLALHELVQLLAPLEDAALLPVLLEALADQPLVAILISAALTWAAHSSVTMVVLIMSLASHGLVSPTLAYALVLGANLGTAINPVLEGSSINDPASRRLPMGNLGTRIVGCILGLLILPWIPLAMDLLTTDASRAVANFHTLFNVTLALLFFPFLEPYAAFITRMFPKRANPDDPTIPLYLDESAHEVPDIALGNATREALRVADMLQSLLGMSRASLSSYDHERLTRARCISNAVNRLETLITTYLGTMDRENMSKDDDRRLNDIIVFLTNVSRASGVVANRMLLHTDNLVKHGWTFSPKQRDQLIEVLERLMRNQRRMTTLFMTEDVRSARYLAYEKDHFRQLEAHAAEQHLSEIKTGKHQQVEVGSTFLDILRDGKTVNSYLVEASAYPILAHHDELLPNRLRARES